MSKVVHCLLPQERDALLVKLHSLSKKAGLKPKKSHLVTHIDVEDNKENKTLVKVRQTFQEQGQEWVLHGEFERLTSSIHSIPKSFVLTVCRSSDASDLVSLEAEALRIQALHMGTSS